jgi:hypothetical protein
MALLLHDLDCGGTTILMAKEVHIKAGLERFF